MIIKTVKIFVLKNRYLQSVIKPIWHLYRRITVGYTSIDGLKGRIHYNDIFDPHDLNHYKGVSIESLNLIQQALTLSGQSSETISSVLVYPCGYGRELHSIITIFDPQIITAADVNSRAVSFCASEFSVLPLVAKEDLSKVCFKNKYSLIWCGSLFTHLPEDRFGQLFNLLSKSLKSGGLLLFTTHEEESFNRLEHYEIRCPVTKNKLRQTWEDKGFVFIPYPWTDDYGISISSGAHIKKLNNELKQPLTPLFHLKKGWDNHQSVYCFKNT